MIEVLFCDTHLLAVNKPAGIPSQPNESGEPNAEELAKEWLKKESGKENPFLEAVHRLDKPVSGILLFARRTKALSRMHELQRAGHFKKTYHALVEGTLPPEGTWVDFLSHDDHRARLDPQGKESKLSYRVLKESQGCTLVEIDLHTGRYHQIRLQFASRGHPIIGDTKYGSKMPWEHPGIALHHSRLVTKHPMSGEELVIKKDFFLLPH